MSIRVMADVYDYGPDDPIDCAVLVCLASHSNDDGQSCYPSVGRIARMTRYSERTVIRSIATLEAGGWLRVKHGRGRGVVSQYTIQIEHLKRCQSVTLKAEKTCPSVTLSKTEKVTLTTGKGDSHDNPPAPPIRCNRQEPSEEQKQKQIQKQSPLPPLPGGEKQESQLRAAWTGVMQDLHIALVNPSLAQRTAERLRGDDDWQRCFGELEFAGIERDGTRVSALVIRAPNPTAAQAGLEKYAKRIHASMEKYFGQPVRVVLDG